MSEKSDDGAGVVSEEADGRARLVRALRVREHATRGIAVGIAAAVGLYLLSVGRSGSLPTRLLYLLLLFVLALTTSAVVTTVLVVAEAYKLAHDDDRPEPR